MAAISIEETNGDPGKATFDPSSLNLGSADKPDLDPKTNGVSARADGHSFEKYVRILVTDMNGSSAVDNFKVWLSAKAGDWKTDEGISTNLSTDNYVQASYAAPVDTDSKVAVNPIPESEPKGPNLGISGSLTGKITKKGSYSDYAVFQLDVSERTQGGSVSRKVITFQYDEQ